MAITVRDLLKLPHFESVNVVAGHRGLDKPVTSVGILDYEYADGYTMKEQLFRKNDLVVSSLLFAKDNPKVLLDVLRELIELGTAGFAYKSALIDLLPAEVLEMADKNCFPILKFGMDLYFEEFIFRAFENITMDHEIREKEKIIASLIAGTMPKEELRQAVKKIVPYSEDNLYCIYVARKKRMEYSNFERLYRGPTGIKHIDDTVTISYFKNGYFLIFTSQFEDEKWYIDRFRDVMAHLDLNTDGGWIGCGTLVRSPEEFDLGLQQAYFASICAQLKRQQSQAYQNIGVYKILLPNLGSPHQMSYMRQFLFPILEKAEDGTDELLNTAIAYVSEDGDVGKVADRIYCHKNTVRYRLNKLHELLSPNSSTSAFYEQLSLAVKIYLLCQLDGI